MRAALLIAAKDLRERLRDRSAVMIAVVVPLALAAIFSLTLHDVTGGSIRFEYALADEDRGPVARAFREGILAGLEREGLVDLTVVARAEQARALAEADAVGAAFVLPAGLSEAIAGGEPATLPVIGSADAPIASQVARSIVDGFAAELNAVRLAVATVRADAGGDTDPAALAAAAARTPRPIELIDVSTERRELDTETFYAAGMAVFFLFFTVQFGVTSLLDERRNGTLWRLVAAPIQRGSILGGKLLTSFVLGLVSMVVLAVTTSLLLGADWGDPVGVALVLLAGVLAAIGVMALIATIARTAEQAGYAQAIAALTLGLLGGAFFPVARVGGVIATLSLLTPHAWFLRGLGELSGGGGPAAVLPAVGAMLAFAAVTGGVALARLGRMVEP
ncbi:MAG: ABC transporter permease [Thermoleophilia bacterium]|nr:ABC transporter permease [Thermoleophilia bacterium]